MVDRRTARMGVELVVVALAVVVVVHEERCARAVWASVWAGCEILPLGVEWGQELISYSTRRARTFFHSLHVPATFD